MTSKRSYSPCTGRKNAALAVCLALAIAVLAVAAPGLSVAEMPAEYQIKAAFVHNIAKFVQWPEGALADPEEPFGLYILGEDRFGSAFDSFEDKIIHNRFLSVHRIEAWEDIPDDCRILFVGVSERMGIQRVLRKVADRAILTISDVPSFTESEGIIGLLTVNNKLRFTVNRSSASKAGLIISSNLLKLALSIHGEIQ
ncbi:MAG: YfiR family protein [bacterium]|nr:YfiR family protein [bacterium]MDT8366756.1 YfiR family protein [bacterium]